MSIRKGSELHSMDNGSIALSSRPDCFCEPVVTESYRKKGAIYYMDVVYVHNSVKHEANIAARKAAREAARDTLKV